MVLLLGLGLRFLGLSLRLSGMGLRFLAYSLWGYQPFGLLSFGATCRVTCSLLALLAIRLVRFGPICLLRVLAFGAARLAAGPAFGLPLCPKRQNRQYTHFEEAPWPTPSRTYGMPHAAHLLVV